MDYYSEIGYPYRVESIITLGPWQCGSLWSPWGVYVKSVQEHSKDVLLAKSFEESSFDSYGSHYPFITSLALTCISSSW